MRPLYTCPSFRIFRFCPSLFNFVSCLSSPIHTVHVFPHVVTSLITAYGYWENSSKYNLSFYGCSHFSNNFVRLYDYIFRDLREVFFIVASRLFQSARVNSKLQCIPLELLTEQSYLVPHRVVLSSIILFRSPAVFPGFFKKGDNHIFRFILSTISHPLFHRLLHAIPQTLLVILIMCLLAFPHASQLFKLGFYRILLA